MATSTKETATNREARLDALYDRLAINDLAPYWAVDSEADHDEDGQVLKGSKALPYIWRYEDINPILYEAAELITMEDSERRSVVLLNPGLDPVRAAVSSLYVAYRLNDPREIMPPHAHSINAVRIGLTGRQNFTGVEGEDITFGPGDLVLTPSEAFHNHGNHGDDFAVNVSVLDLPLCEFLNAAEFDHGYAEEKGGKKISPAEQTAKYAEDYSRKIYGHSGLLPRFVDHKRGTGRHSPMYVYRWDETRNLLEGLRDHDGSPWDAISVEYRDPVTGRTPFPTMTFIGQMLRPGEKTLPQKQNASQVCIAFEGAGSTIVDGQKFDWKPFDTVAVPGGTWFQHENASDKDDAILFVASDEPTLKTLGWHRRQGKTKDGTIVRLD